MKASLLAVALALTAGPLLAGEVSITLPPEPHLFKPGAGVELAQVNCLICHSAEYPATQPPLPKKFWEGTVKKMREKYGAPIPEEAIPGLVEYLTRTYGAPDPAK